MSIKRFILLFTLPIDFLIKNYIVSILFFVPLFWLLNQSEVEVIVLKTIMVINLFLYPYAKYLWHSLYMYLVVGDDVVFMSDLFLITMNFLSFMLSIIFAPIGMIFAIVNNLKNEVV